MKNFNCFSDFTSHLIHCIQEAEGIQLSQKSIDDIEHTIQGSNRYATSGMKRNMNDWRNKYYEQKFICERLVRAMELEAKYEPPFEDE